jgi:hypothetical protein
MAAAHGGGGGAGFVHVENVGFVGMWWWWVMRMVVGGNGDGSECHGMPQQLRFLIEPKDTYY